METLTCRGQNRLPDTPLEQQHAQVFLKPFDVTTDGTVTDMQLLGREAEALMTSGDRESANRIQGRELIDHASNLVTYAAQLKRLSRPPRQANLPARSQRHLKE